MGFSSNGKPLVTPDVFERVISLINEVGEDGIPFVVKTASDKEPYLASQFKNLAEVVAEQHFKVIENNYKIQISDTDKQWVTLDSYVLAWLSYILNDSARDADFENFFKKHYDSNDPKK